MNPWRYVGGYGVSADAGDGLLYMRASYQDPGSGVFISRDPIGLRGGVNLYGYVGSNPILYRDEFGRAPRGIGLSNLMDCARDAIKGASDQCQSAILGAGLACAVVCAIPPHVQCSVCISFALQFATWQCFFDVAWVVANLVSCATTGRAFQLTGLPPSSPPPVWPVVPAPVSVPIRVPMPVPAFSRGG